ncbi:hypothetical protein WMY93_000580 [Mugilogobius chulae]|uniref:ZP domain-containing protein n=1 Tax=Mugilogobius chulae TaxID=88201 RepID=A0AAW0Q2U8_9GOBI
MFFTTVVVLQLLWSSLASASHYYGSLATFRAKRDSNGNYGVEMRTKVTFDGCHISYGNCYSGNCGYDKTLDMGVIDSSTNAPVHNYRWCETETVITKTLTSNRPFQTRDYSCCWIWLSSGQTPSWSILTTVDLGIRSDTNKPNNSPNAATLPFLRVPQNCRRTYKLSSFDPDGDKVRCRYGMARHTECYECTQHYGFLVDQPTCTLQYLATSSQGVYAFELVVEDFPHNNIRLFYSDGYSSVKYAVNNRRKRAVTTPVWLTTTTEATTSTAPVTISYFITTSTSTTSAGSTYPPAAQFTTKPNTATAITTSAASTYPPAAQFTTKPNTATAITTSAASTYPPAAAQFTTKSNTARLIPTSAAFTYPPATQFTTKPTTTTTITMPAATTYPPTARFPTKPITTAPITTSSATTSPPTHSTLTSFTTPPPIINTVPFTMTNTSSVHLVPSVSLNSTATRSPKPAPSYTTATTTTGPLTTNAITSHHYNMATINHATTLHPLILPSWGAPLSQLPMQFTFQVDPPAPSCIEGDFIPKFVSPTPFSGQVLLAEPRREVEIKVKAEAKYSALDNIIMSGPLNVTKHKTTGDEFSIRWTPLEENLGEYFPICFAVEFRYGSAIYQTEMRCVIVSVTAELVKTVVTCQDSSMIVEVEKATLPRLAYDHLRLSDDPSNTVCSLQTHSNSTHIVAIVPLNACGTQIEEDEENLLFKNEITTVENASAIITRRHQVEIMFYCQYAKKGNVTLTFSAHRENVTVWDKGLGLFTYEFEFYPDQRFASRMDPNLYPLEYWVGERIYMKIEATTAANNTELFVESCRAAPFDNANYPIHTSSSRMG